MKWEWSALPAWPILLALSIGGPAWSEQAGALPKSLRNHLRGEQFVSISAVASLPAGVRDGLQALWHSPKFEMAEPGSEFQATDVVTGLNLPIRRLILAGCSGDHCLIYYEHGGIAHAFAVVLFETKSGVRFEWGGAAPRDLVDLAEVQAAILSGKIRGETTY